MPSLLNSISEALDISFIIIINSDVNVDMLHLPPRYQLSVLLNTFGFVNMINEPTCIGTTRLKSS